MRTHLLTLRESQIARMIAVEFLTSKEIGKRLNLSHRTIEAHRGEIMRKLGISHMGELARVMALREDAAAPDLLAALKGYLTLFDTMANGIEVSPIELALSRDAMRAAIAKAEGRA